MPTRENLLHLESLVDATTLLAETKRNVERVESEIRTTKGTVLRRDGQLGGGDSRETLMDVDEEAVVDNDEAGIQPGRGARKKNVGPPCRRTRRFGHSLTHWCYRRDDPCRCLPSTPRLSPDGQTKGRSRVKYLS
jgi:hypothetical protein